MAWPDQYITSTCLLLMSVHSQIRQLLITVGLEEPGISTATVKIWEPEKVISAVAAAAATNSAAAAMTSLPQTGAVSSTPASIPPLRLQRVFSNKYPESEVTALAVAETGTTNLLVAVGLAAGSVYLFSGDMTGPKGKLQHTGKLNVRPDSGDLWRVSALAFKQGRSSSSSSRTDRAAATSAAGSAGVAGSGPAAAGASSSSSSAVSPAGASSRLSVLSGRSAAAEGAAATSPADSEQQWLYVVTESQTLVFAMADQSKVILDQQGLISGACATLRDGLLMVARDDALYEYATDTRAGCTAFEGESCYGLATGIGLSDACEVFDPLR